MGPLWLLAISITIIACSNEGTEAMHHARIIPQPQSVQVTSEKFDLNTATVLVASEQERATADYLQRFIDKATGTSLSFAKKADKNAIALQISPSLLKSLGEEGYQLKISKDGVRIDAATETGLFYGVQSLRQQLPTSYEQQDGSALIETSLSGLNIQDQPRFRWRGLMLDEARHFQGKLAVLQLLDQMALLKLNRFHWHLTDYQGWRIEIKKYPKLTEVGAHRNDTETGEPMGWGSGEFAGKPHSGHYTQEEIREILRYATERHIQVIPEIEMPGHSSAAIAAYPWLGVSPEPIEVPTTNGPHLDVFNIADPRVVEFIHDVLDEVVDVFPSNIIHIGGDEVAYDHWKSSNEIKQLMAQKGLASYGDLQVDFTNSISQYLHSKGRRMMGWNDILGGDIHEWQDGKDTEVQQELAKDTIVQFWKGDTQLISDAANSGYEIVNAIHSETYLDYPYYVISLRKAYHFNPIPEDLSAKAENKIIGINAQAWTEFMPTPVVTQSMIFPRLAAYAEVGWVAGEGKNFDDFQARMIPLVERWDAAGVAYNAERLQDSWLSRLWVTIMGFVMSSLL